jgi:hypothetical protein
MHINVILSHDSSSEENVPTLPAFVPHSLTHKKKNKKKNYVALVRKRKIHYRPTAAVGEVSANFLRIEGVAWSAQRIPTAVNFSVF